MEIVPVLMDTLPIGGAFASTLSLHIVFDAEMRIIHHGDKLARLCPTRLKWDQFQ
jgi:hypothetical protein